MCNCKCCPYQNNPKKKRAETAKRIVWLCLFNGLAWVWCSYILALIGRDAIAESLSQTAVTEIIAVVLVYCIKSLVENLSKNNRWPDKIRKEEIFDEQHQLETETDQP